MRGERGVLLVEFALTALLFYVLLAIMLDFGRLYFTAQVTQGAVRAGATELARTPLPAGYTFDQALADPLVRARVYDDDLLVVDLDTIPGGLDLATWVGTWPVLNQMLRPAMIFENVGGRRLLRFPGALLDDPSRPTGLTVLIPLVVSRDGTGVETIAWVSPVEEITNPDFPGESPFDATSAVPQRGMVALRINVPWQAAASSGFLGSGLDAPNIGNPIEADPASVTASPLPGGVSLRADDGTPGVYAGPYGLGRQLAFGRQVRPFRKLISVQALARREVFE